MPIGWLISAVLHAMLIVVLLWGGALFQREDRDLRRVANVSLISAAEFDAQTSSTPEVAPDIAVPDLNTLDAPEAEADAGEAPEQDVAPVATVADFVEDPSDADAQADLSALTEQVAAPEVATAVDAPDEAPETATLAMPGLSGMDNINQAPRAPSLNRPPSPVQAPRIAGTESPKPPKPDKPAEVAQDATVPSEQETETAEAQEATVEEQSTTAATPNAPSGEEDGIALRRSSAPRARPRDFEQQLAKAEEDRQEAEQLAKLEEERREKEEQERLAQQQRDREERERQEENERIAAEVAAAVAAAQAEAQQPAQAQGNQAPEAPRGPPLTSGEKDGLRLAVQRCWNIPAGLPQSSELRVVLGVDLDPDGRIVGQITLLEPAGSDRQEIRIAFEAARRALLRCQGSGYELPRDKYEQWKRLEVGFNPEGMLARW